MKKKRQTTKPQTMMSLMSLGEGSEPRSGHAWIINKTAGKHTAFNACSHCHDSGKGSHTSRGKNRFTIFLKRIIFEQVNRCSSLPSPSNSLFHFMQFFFFHQWDNTAWMVQCRAETRFLTQTKLAGDPEPFQSEQFCGVWSSFKHPRLRNRSVVSEMQNWLWVVSWGGCVRCF